MNFLYNKPLAYFSTVVMVIFSIVVLGGNSLKRELVKVEAVFYGENEYNINAEYECLEIIAQANNLLVISGRYIDKDDSLMNEVSFLTERNKGDNSLEKLVALTNDIKEPLYNLLDKLREIGVSDRDREYILSIGANVDAGYRKIDLTGYNDMALRFNKIKSGTYAGIIAGIRGIKNMPLF